MAEILLEASHIHKSYGGREVLAIDRLVVADGDRIGLIGENGAGKTTLLRILTGEAEADTGTVHRRAPLALIRQEGGAEDAGDPAEQAVFRAPEEHDGLSGGEATRRRIAAALSAHPRLLLADEPTTDLDAEGIRLLRKRLLAFDGAILLVSHDRELLRSVCTRIWQLEGGGLTDFQGGYDAWQEERKRRRDFAQFEYEQYREEEARLKASAQRMAERASQVRKAPKRMGNSEARLHKREASDAVLRLSHAKRTLQNRLDKLEKKEKPSALPEIRMMLGVAHPIPARTALSVRCRRLAAGGRTLLENTGFTLPAGSRTALLGANGCGKTTLLGAAAGIIPEGVQFSGDIRLHPEARVGRFDQHHENTLRMELSALENALGDTDQPESLARNVLARLGMDQERIFRPAEKLSGGERGKTALARLLLSDCNLLILDEPTNHLDVYTLEALEELLAGYGGTLLLVSHDEAFVRAVATRLVRFDGTKLDTFEGTPAELEEKERRSREDEGRALAVTALEMRLAELTARMSAPKKGDSPEALNAEWLRLAAELREMKRG